MTSDFLTRLGLDESQFRAWGDREIGQRTAHYEITEKIGQAGSRRRSTLAGRRLETSPAIQAESTTEEF